MMLLQLILIVFLNKCLLVSSSRPLFKASLGFVYCESEELLEAEEVIMRLNKEYKTDKYKLNLALKSYKLSNNENTISLSLTVCEKLMASEPLYGVVLGKTSCLRPPNASNTQSDYILNLSAISFTCGYYQIPVIDLYNREADFSDNSIYSTFIRLTPPYFHQASVWIELVKKFEWKSVNLVYNDANEGKMLAARFHYLADQHEIKVSTQ
jgi:hypothetical protein